MEKVALPKDMDSFELFSMSELDSKFFLDQLSTSRVSADGSDSKPSNLAFLCTSSDLASPTPGQCPNDSNVQEVKKSQLLVPPQCKSSTPYFLFQKQEKNVYFEQSYNDLTASQMSWDQSLINPASNSPKLCMELSALENAEGLNV
ncbi:uncharacterized protein si:ch73-303b9.1 [Nerophis ophidion]|uniref:uncharacterized protein si:ch73-303b9.1 n=1 Tax=Nerophis ophidion TaxID=159077 RepID=UPI002ADFA349|nr:uncharacterized protein si:ch73-303b9.1 [Nerophis ophidion]